MTDPYPADFLKRQSIQTEGIRHHFYDKFRIQDYSAFLDVGCGVGYSTVDLSSFTNGFILGLDIDIEAIKYSKGQSVRNIQYLIADAHHLPIRKDSIFFVQLHFVLMWTQNPVKVLQEVENALTYQGVVIALESDYSGRIENIPSYKPSTSKNILPMVSKLAETGAHPYIGHQLPRLIYNIGLSDIKFGILSWEFHKNATAQDLRDDLKFSDRQIKHKLPIYFTYTPVLWITAIKDSSI